MVRADPARVAELAALTGDGDWLVSLRALDLLEKLAHEHPDWVAGHKGLFIGPLAESDAWEVHLQIVRALPLFEWTAAERPRVLEILRANLDHRQLFVRAWALDGLASLAAGDSSLQPLVRRYLRSFETSGRPALATRARLIRRRLFAHELDGGQGNGRPPRRV
jgi:hypothetical protein